MIRLRLSDVLFWGVLLWQSFFLAKSCKYFQGHTACPFLSHRRAFFPPVTSRDTFYLSKLPNWPNFLHDILFHFSFPPKSRMLPSESHNISPFPRTESAKTITERSRFSLKKVSSIPISDLCGQLHLPTLAVVYSFPRASSLELWRFTNFRTSCLVSELNFQFLSSINCYF